MRIIYDVEHLYVIRSKFGDKFLSSLTKLVLEAKASICFTIKKTYFYIVVRFRHLLPLSKLNIFLEQGLYQKKQRL